MKRKLALVIALIMITVSTVGAAPEEDEMTSALFGIGNATFATIASSDSTSSVYLDGVTLENYEAGNGQSRATISYLRTDLVKLKNNLSSPSSVSGDNLFQRLWSSASARISPMVRLSILSIESMELNEGDLILDGTITLDFINRLPSIVDLVFNIYFRGNFELINVKVDISVIVSGALFKEPLRFEGELFIKGNNELKALILTTESMTCNGQEIGIRPMYFSFTDISSALHLDD